MGLSINTFTFTGNETFPLNFAGGIGKRQYIDVQVNDEEVGGLPVYRDFVWVDDDNITVSGLNTDDVVSITRTVPKEDLEVQFSGPDDDVTYANLDDQSRQALFIYHEILDGRTDIDGVLARIADDLEVGAGIQVTTISDLRLYVGPIDSFIIDGYVFSTDGTTGHTSAEDDGGVNIVTSSGVLYTRQYEGNILAEWFGVATANTPADNKTAGQAALDYAATVAGTVEYPAGTVVSGKLVIASGVTLCGVSREASVLQSDPALGTSSRFINNTNQSTYTDTDITVRDITIDFNGNGNEDLINQTRFAAFVSLSRITRLTLKDVTFRNGGYIGLSTLGSRQLTATGVWCHDLGYAGSTTANGGSGWYATSPDGTTAAQPADVNITQCRFYDNNWHGIHIGGDRVYVDNNYFFNNTETHLFASDDNAGDAYYCRVGSISNNHFEDVTLKDISAHALDLEVSDFVIANNYISGADRGGIAIQNSYNTKVVNNTIKNISKDGGGGAIDIVTTSAGVDHKTDRILVTGNIVFDDQDTPTTRLAVSITGTGPEASRLRIVDNDFSFDGFTTGTALSVTDPEWNPTNSVYRNNGDASDAPFYAEVTVPTSTGAFSWSDCPFPPSRIEVTAIGDITEDGSSTAEINCRDNTHVYNFTGNGISRSADNTLWRLVTSGGTNKSIATLSSVTSSGFTAFHTYTSGTVKLQIKAYA